MIWHIKNHYMPGHCEIILRIFTGRIPAYVLKTLFFFSTGKPCIHNRPLCYTEKNS